MPEYDDVSDFLETVDFGDSDDKPAQKKEQKAIQQTLDIEEEKPKPTPVEVDLNTDTDAADFLDDLDGGPAPKAPPPTAPAKTGPDAAFEDPEAWRESSGLKEDREVPDITYPWMKHHTFTLVATILEVNRIVDECIERGFCALDLECEGLDNRIIYNDDGKPETVHKIVGYCISYDGEEGFYIPVRHQPTDGGPNLNLNPVEVDKAINRLCHAAVPEGTPEDIEKDPLSYKCEPPKVVIGFWNAQFDQEFLYPVTGIDWWHPESFEDGMLAAFVVNSSDKRISLKVKSRQMLADPDGNPYQQIELKELFFGKTRNIQFHKLAPDEPGVKKYTGADGICTYKLCVHPDLVPLCHEKYEFTYRLEKQTTCVLRAMERNRVRITREEVRKTLAEEESKREELYNRIQKFAQLQGRNEVDPNSPKQLSEFLFSRSGMDITPKPDINKASGQYKTDAETLKNLAKKEHAPPILKDIVEFREVEKFIGTYLTGLVNNPDENDELRFSFKQTGAASGRFSAPAGQPDHGYSGIPVHGIPGGSEIRRVFEAREGYTMVKADYAGEELRIAANESEEPVWIDEFLHGDGDLHSITARAFFNKPEVTKEERKGGKIANFSLLYGGGPQAIIRATGCSLDVARTRKKAFDKAVPTFAGWIKGQHKRVKKEMGVWTAFGRWLPIPDANSEERAIRAACERHSVNYVVQGTGADIMKISMILLHKAFYKRGWLKNGDDSVRMLLTVHDEVVCEIRHDRVAEAIPLIVDLMESPWTMPRQPTWRVPLIVEPLVGFNWASGYEARLVTEAHPAKDGEVVMNGFAYSMTRKPRTGKDDEIVETLDRNEVQDGKVFRVVDPPWLMGTKPGEQVVLEGPAVDKPVPDPEKIAKPKPEPDPEPESEKSAEEPKSQDEPIPDPEPEPEEPEQPVSDDTLVLRINQLNERTVNQLVCFVLEEGDKDGPLLHLTDIVGTTLIPASLNLRVNRANLISKLQDHNLLCSSENEDGSD